jgi:branched-chain amino acid transport system permease protein
MPAWIDAQLVSLLNGLCIGSLLFIVSIGLSLVFGMMDVLNLAHGVLFLVGSYGAWAIAGPSPGWLGFLAALVAAAAVGGSSGALLSLACDRLARRAHLQQALLTLGVALIGAEVLSLLFGNDVHSVNPPPGLDASTRVLGQIYPVYRLWLIAVGVAIAGAAHWTLERTLLGALVRASVADRQMLAAVGFDARRIEALVFALGAALATCAGVLGAPVYGVRPGLDTTILILALVVVVLSGLGSIRGTLLAALVIGQIETLGRALLSDLASFLLFGVLALALILRPRGLLGAAAGSRA